MSPAEVLLMAIVAARYFNNNLERTLIILEQTGHIPLQRRLSVSRFNRQLHRYQGLLGFCLETLLVLDRDGETFIIDSMPVPVCKRKRAKRCRKVRGRPFCGYCAAKGQKFFGWRLHLICTPAAVPVKVTIPKTAAHNEFDTIVHTLNKALAGTAKVGEDLLASIVKGIQEKT